MGWQEQLDKAIAAERIGSVAQLSLRTDRARREAGRIANDERVTDSCCLDRVAQVVTVPFGFEGTPNRLEPDLR